MSGGELTGVLMAAALAVLAFGVSRWAVRYFARRRAGTEQAAKQVTQATQSRQVRRASERRKR